MSTASPPNAHLALERLSDGTLLVLMGGTWQLESGFLSSAAVEREFGADPPDRVRFDTTALGAWDSGILALMVKISALSRAHGSEFDASGLPDGLERLLGLAEAVPEKDDARAEDAERRFIDRIGAKTLETQSLFRDDLEFLGRFALAMVRALRGKARFRLDDLGLLVQQNGIDALPIVTLVTFLLGLILAFVGATALQSFGAAIYVADLVGVAMVRDMGALITGIIMAGRSGASFAAQIGSMKVTQETDALTTMAISPMEFLVLPRVIALSLMMPLLTLYGDAMGMLGGAFVGYTMLDLSGLEYFQQTVDAVGLNDVIGGVFKGSVYGVLIALAGCLRGMQSGKSSSAVGDAATSGVVTSLVAIIVACGLFSFVFYLLGL